MNGIQALYSRVGSTTRTLECCDTEFEVHAAGRSVRRGIEAAIEVARDLESQLDAFDPESAVSRLNSDGSVRNEHVANVVRRGLEYERLTDGVFSIRHGGTEQAVKAYIRDGETDPVVDDPEVSVSVERETVTTSGPLDLNGIAKGYLVDHAHEALDTPGRRGYVNGGGDIAGQVDGGIAIDNPWGTDPLRVLETTWSIATSGTYKRRRGGVNHIYRPTEGAVGALNDHVTVVASRDTTEADVLATTAAAMHPEAALEFIEDWSGAEAFLVHDGVFQQTEGFDAHVA